MSDVITNGKIGIFHYTLTNDDGDSLDSSAGGEPMPYLHGSGNIVPGLETASEGKGVGEKIKISVPPEEGYGQLGSSRQNSIGQ